MTINLDNTRVAFIEREELARPGGLGSAIRRVADLAGHGRLVVVLASGGDPVDAVERAAAFATGLTASGVAARALGPAVAGPVCRETVAGYEPRTVAAGAIADALRTVRVVVIAGGIGLDDAGRPVALLRPADTAALIADRVAIAEVAPVEIETDEVGYGGRLGERGGKDHRPSAAGARDN